MPSRWLREDAKMLNRCAVPTYTGHSRILNAVALDARNREIVAYGPTMKICVRQVTSILFASVGLLQSDLFVTFRARGTRRNNFCPTLLYTLYIELSDPLRNPQKKDYLNSISVPVYTVYL